jgi:hypothetical protein
MCTKISLHKGYCAVYIAMLYNIIVISWRENTFTEHVQPTLRAVSNYAQPKVHLQIKKKQGGNCKKFCLSNNPVIRIPKIGLIRRNPQVENHKLLSLKKNSFVMTDVFLQSALPQHPPHDQLLHRQQAAHQGR